MSQHLALFPKVPTRKIILDESRAYKLDPDLVAAIIHQESRGNPFARRAEDAFYDQYIRGKSRAFLRGHWPATVSEKTERRDRSYSFGLMQILLQVAREYGFKSDDALDLLVPETNIHFGCLIFRSYLDQYNSEHRALLRWNGGADKSYPDKVLGHVDTGAMNYLLTGLE